MQPRPNRIQRLFAIRRNHQRGKMKAPFFGQAFVHLPRTLSGVDDAKYLRRLRQPLCQLLRRKNAFPTERNPAKTVEAIIEIDGQRWYRTGDKGHVDEDGFLTIVDRYSRFAKLGGEMVSLSAVEQQVRQILQNPELELDYPKPIVDLKTSRLRAIEAFKSHLH